jgi:hypothetical protein
MAQLLSIQSSADRSRPDAGRSLAHLWTWRDRPACRRGVSVCGAALLALLACGPPAEADPRDSIRASARVIDATGPRAAAAGIAALLGPMMASQSESAGSEVAAGGPRVATELSGKQVLAANMAGGLLQVCLLSHPSAQERPGDAAQPCGEARGADLSEVKGGMPQIAGAGDPLQPEPGSGPICLQIAYIAN